MKSKSEIENELNILEGELQNMQSATVQDGNKIAEKKGEIKALKWVLGRD